MEDVAEISRKSYEPASARVMCGCCNGKSRVRVVAIYFVDVSVTCTHM